MSARRSLKVATRRITCVRRAKKTMEKVRVEESRRFMEDCLRAVGAPDSEAEAQADLLIHADTVGHYSNGLNRLPFYVNDCKTGGCCPANVPQALNETAATAWVDAASTLGATTGNYCMDLAIRKARESGVGWVAATRCCHFGMAGYWAMKAEREGMIGMAFTNTTPLMVPTRAKQRSLGTNPLAIAAPANDGDKLVVDMATTAVALGKIEMQINLREPMPDGWALGRNGMPTTDPQEAYTARSLMPLGGGEKTSGYKGYALGALVEILCSGLSGSKPSYKVTPWKREGFGGMPNLGHCFAAINPDCFAPCFPDRVTDCLWTWRNLEPINPKLPVLVPGDKERHMEEATLKKGFILYPEKQIQELGPMAKKIGVKPIVTFE